MFYDIFVELCAKKGVKPTRAALDMGLSKATPTLWKNKGYTPRGDIINKVARLFRRIRRLSAGKRRKRKAHSRKSCER